MIEFSGGEYYENQFLEFCVGERDHRRNFVDTLLAAGLDNAGANDEHDRKYGSYGYEQVRLGSVSARRFLGTDYLESVRGNFRVASGNDL